MSRETERSIRVFLMDLWSLVPYYTIALAQGMRSSGLSPLIVSMTYDLDPGCFERAGLRNNPGLLDVLSRRRIRTPGLRRALKLMQGIINLAALSVRIVFIRPEVIHVQQLRLIQEKLPVEMWFLRFARFLGCRIVYTVHNLLPHDTAGRYKAVYQRLYSFVDALVCHSTDVRDRLIADFSVDPRKLCVIPHGPLFESPTDVKAAAVDADSKDLCSVLWQGFVRPYKGIEFLLEGWRNLDSEVRNKSRLIIAGSGEPAYIDQLQAIAAASGISSSVEFCSRFLDVAELTALYRRADIVVYPYRDITTSGALMTGIANAKAIITTDLPPFREILRHGENAMLVPYGNPEALASAFDTLIGNPDLRSRLGRCVSQVNLACSWTSIGEKTRGCYESLLSDNIARVRTNA